MDPNGIKIKCYVIFPGCNVVINQFNGTLTSPAFGKSEIDGYPPNQECIYTIRNPAGTRLSMMFTSLDVHNTDKVQVREQLHRVILENFQNSTKHKFGNFMNCLNHSLLFTYFYKTRYLYYCWLFIGFMGSAINYL